jgi:hypothetical protein
MTTALTFAWQFAAAYALHAMAFRVDVALRR